MLHLRYISLWGAITETPGFEEEWQMLKQFRHLWPWLILDGLLWYLIYRAAGSVPTMAFLVLMVLIEYVFSRVKAFNTLNDVAYQVRQLTRKMCKNYSPLVRMSDETTDPRKCGSDTVRVHHPYLRYDTPVHVIHFEKWVPWLIGVSCFLFPTTSVKGGVLLATQFKSRYFSFAEVNSSGRRWEYHAISLVDFWMFSKAESLSTLEMWVHFMFRHELQHGFQFQYKPHAKHDYQIEGDRSYNYGDIDNATLEMCQNVTHGLHTLFSNRELNIIGIQGLLELDADLQTLFSLRRQYAPKELLNFLRKFRSAPLPSAGATSGIAAYVANRLTGPAINSAESYAQLLADSVLPIVQSDHCQRFIKAIEAQDFETAQEMVTVY